MHTSYCQAGMHWKGVWHTALEGEGGLPPPLQGAQPMPSHCTPDAKCQLAWHL